MGDDVIIDGDILGKRKIIDTTPPYFNIIGLFFNCIKGVDDVELREGEYFENSSGVDFSLNIGRNFVGNPKDREMIRVSYM